MAGLQSPSQMRATFLTVTTLSGDTSECLESFWISRSHVKPWRESPRRHSALA